MAAKAAKAAMPGAHTAGIYADMTVDGPEIGTLVVIVDRAKNLPNRKTMGKQDPYCAARLGKEAKKTETDRRGGQTPRWHGFDPFPDLKTANSIIGIKNFDSLSMIPPTTISSRSLSSMTTRELI